MAITIEEIRRLRELTGVGITDAKQALVESKGDFDKALEAMRKKGLTKADKRSEREARAGVVYTYNHDNRIGVVLEVNCETNFVATNQLFLDMVKDVAMHIAATNPEFIDSDTVDDALKENLQRAYMKKAKDEGKPEKILSQIADGMLKKHFSEVCLMEQAFIKNPDQTVSNYVKEHIAKLGEKIIVRRFSRMALGDVN